MLNWLALRTISGLPRRAWIPLALLAAGLAIMLAVKHHDQRVVRDYRTQVEARASTAREAAADERAADFATLTRTEKDLHDAIDAAPTAGSLSPAAHALSCERLRKLGRQPAACRFERSDGTQADSR